MNADEGVKRTVAAMTLHLDASQVQLEGCRLLGKLADEDENGAGVVSRAGGLHRIVAAMKRHGDNASLVEEACRALHCLLAASEDVFIRETIIQQDCISII